MFIQGGATTFTLNRWATSHNKKTRLNCIKHINPIETTSIKVLFTFQPKCEVYLLELFEDLLLPTEEHSWLLPPRVCPTAQGGHLQFGKKKPTWRLPTYGRIRRCAVRELSWGGGGLLSRAGRGVVDHLGGLVPVCQSECVVSHQSRQLVARSVDVVRWPRARLQGACECHMEVFKNGVKVFTCRSHWLTLGALLSVPRWHPATDWIELKGFYFWKW